MFDIYSGISIVGWKERGFLVLVISLITRKIGATALVSVLLILNDLITLHWYLYLLLTIEILLVKCHRNDVRNTSSYSCLNSFNSITTGVKLLSNTNTRIDFRLVLGKTNK